MQRLSLEQAQAGFVLAKPVTDDKDRVLVGEGTALSDALIDLLRRRGVTSVTVAGHPVQTGEPAGSATPAQRLAFLDQAFARHRDDPVMAQFKEAFIEQIRLKSLRLEAEAQAEAQLALPQESAGNAEPSP